MEELMQLVSQKASISGVASKIAVETVINHLKDKLPAPIASQLDSVLGGGESEGLGSIAKGLGGFFR